MIEVYTDGSATTKDKPGGFGWVIIVDGKFHSEGSGFIPNATNNDAELEAAIVGLANAYAIFPKTEFMDVVQPVGIALEVTLVSDSQIVLGWVNGTYRFKQQAKMDKYKCLQRLHKMMLITTRWVEGHTGVEWNERCDKLAKEARNKAMGITKKPRKDSKKLKAACEKMREVLEYVLRETLQMKADGFYRRDDFEDYCEDALNFYKENT